MRLSRSVVDDNRQDLQNRKNPEKRKNLFFPEVEIDARFFACFVRFSW
tara:strand:+ start:400 stop:543 length:144 start_codon:yes stop_codon:yes gene_type:complete